MIRYPNFRPILAQCRKLIKINYPKYGNSWVRFSQKWWWKRRLQTEINEIFRAKDSLECEAEICDAINILSMMYENAENFRYGKKKK